MQTLNLHNARKFLHFPFALSRFFPNFALGIKTMVVHPGEQRLFAHASLVVARAFLLPMREPLAQCDIFGGLPFRKI